MFSIKRTKTVVSLIYDSCFIAIGCKSESMKLEISFVGPPLPEKLILVCRLGLVYVFLSLCRMPVFWVVFGFD